MSGADQETEGRANELYWTSDLSVNQIAEELDLSIDQGIAVPRVQGIGSA